LQLPSAVAAPPGTESALKASDITNKIFPDQVFFRGQVAPVQMRNAGGIRFSDDFYALTSLVDNSGYSSDIRQKYQAYLITEVTLTIGGQKLAPGAYGIGFLTGNKFVVMDIGAHDLFQGIPHAMRKSKGRCLCRYSVPRASFGSTLAGITWR